MAESYGIMGDATDVRYTNQPAWLQYIRDLRLNGYVDGVGSELVVSAPGTGMTVTVGTGEAWIQGNYYDNDAVVTFNIEAADPDNPRIDRVVARNDINGKREITVMVLKGVASASPVAPDRLTSNDFYDLVLADIAVAAAAEVIISANVTDQRAGALCGIASPALVWYSNLIADGSPFDMNHHKLTGVSMPTADTDGVTIAYRNSLGLKDPVGAIDDFAGDTIPTGWLECNGATFSSSTYPDLYTLLGGTTLPSIKGVTVFGYNSSDTDFNSIGKTGGEKTVALSESTMPSHKHTGTFTNSLTGVRESYGTENEAGFTFQAINNGTVTGSAGSGTAHQNMPPYVVMKKIIKAVA